MTVKELKELLEGIDENTVIVMSRDSEGNGYSPLYGVDDSMYYFADSTWSGEIHMVDELTPELIKAGYTEEDVWDAADGVPCVTLWPVN